MLWAKGCPNIAKDEADAKKKEIEDKARKDADDWQQKRLAEEKKKRMIVARTGLPKQGDR